MAISHSNHMFVSLAFVFCLLSSLARVSDSYGEHTALPSRTTYDFISDKKKRKKKEGRGQSPFRYSIWWCAGGARELRFYTIEMQKAAARTWRLGDVDDTRDNNILCGILILKISRLIYCENCTARNNTKIVSSNAHVIRYSYLKYQIFLFLYPISFFGKHIVFRWANILYFDFSNLLSRTLS